MAGGGGSRVRRAVMRRLGAVFLMAVMAAGCADLQAIFAPPPPKTPPAKRESPPPVLSPQVGREDEDRLSREANARIRKAEQTVQQIDQKKLAKDQQGTLSTIRSFLANAREALTARDFPRATNLAEKAQILAEELVRTLQ